MRIQKCYMGYCAVTWLLWITTLVLVPISGGAFDVHNEALYHFVNVCIDLAMRGVGSKSCGPDLPQEYEIPKTYKNTFTFKF